MHCLYLAMRALKMLGWTLSILGVIASFVGGSFGWGRQLFWFDEALHVVVAFAVTLIIAGYAHDSLFRLTRGYVGWRTWLLAAAGLAVGAVWEIGQWVMDGAFAGDLSKNKRDVITDLLADMAGAIVAALLASLVASGRRERAPVVAESRLRSSA